jgi:hypothetical protein
MRSDKFASAMKAGSFAPPEYLEMVASGRSHDRVPISLKDSAALAKAGIVQVATQAS